MARKEYPPTNKPYVAYRIIGTGNFDAGLAYAMRKGVQAHFSGQKFAATTAIEVADADHFEIVFQIMDNGRIDFNAKNLLDHLTNSGRQPTDVNHRAEIKIVPIPFDHEIKIIEESRGDESWRKIVEDKQKKIDEKNDAIKTYQKMLETRSNEFKELEQKNADLEKKVSTLVSLPKQYDDPVSAVIHGYLPKSIDSLLEASADWESITSSRDKELFLEKKGNFTYLEYLHANTGIEFKTEDEFKKWTERIAFLPAWEDTDEGKRYSAEKLSLENDKKSLTILEKENTLTPDVRNSIAGIISTKEKKIAEIEQAAMKYKQDTEREKRAYEKIVGRDMKKDYIELRKIMNKALERRKAEFSIPIIASYSPERDSLNIYLPSIESEGTFESGLHDKIRGLFPLGKYNLTSADMSSQGFYSIDVSLANIPKKNRAMTVRRAISKISSLKSDPSLYSLGVSLKVITIAET